MNSRGASAADIFSRLQLRGESSASWFVMISSGGARSTHLREFRSDFEVLAGAPVRIVDCEEMPIDAIAESSQNPDDDIVILVGLEEWSAVAWETLDLNRSSLERKGPLIFWLPEKAVAQMFECAPNVRSYLASSLFHLVSDGSEMTDEERLARLKDLSERFSMTGDEVIQRAEQGTLPSSPSFVEWLILLKRGDLL